MAEFFEAGTSVDSNALKEIQSRSKSGWLKKGHVRKRYGEDREREVVFAFDGDRAGRAAAWRALQHALPEARQGREIRFLFLPDGHDPDSLVGEEGAEAFERRLDATLPLSEYLIRELSEHSDLTHADGRARFSENARPLWTKLPEGVYRELMLARIAEVVGIAPQRLQDTDELAATLKGPPRNP